MFLFCWLLIAVGWSHPFGSNLYGHKTEVWLSAEKVEVAYLLEIPTPVLLQELRSFFADVESPTQVDQDRHTAETLAELQAGLRILANGQPLRWTRVPTDAVSGVGDSRFISYQIRLEAPLSDDVQTLNLINGNRPDETALFSTEVFVSPNIVLDQTSLIDVNHHGDVDEDRTGSWRGSEEERELRLAFRHRTQFETSVHQGFQRVLGEETVTFEPARAALSTVKPEVLHSLVKGELTPAAVLIALILSFVLGAAHAFSPGHGKALVAAYLLGERKSIRHAITLGMIVTATHTVTVFLLGAIALLLSEVFPTEKMLPWMELFSGFVVLGVGLQLVRQRWKGPSGSRLHEAHHHDHHYHGHHHHDHHQHEHHNHDHHHHDHHHPGPDGGDAHAAAHAAEIADTRTPRDLIALGISGGIVPCPSALVLLLTAISFHRIAFGMLLVFVFSMGLAIVVSLVGIAVVLMGGRLATRAHSGFVVEWLPRMSAVVVSLIGIGISVKGAEAVWTMMAG